MIVSLREIYVGKSKVRVPLVSLFCIYPHLIKTGVIAYRPNKAKILKFFNMKDEKTLMLTNARANNPVSIFRMWRTGHLKIKIF